MKQNKIVGSFPKFLFTEPILPQSDRFMFPHWTGCVSFANTDICLLECLQVQRWKQFFERLRANGSLEGA